MRLKVQADAPVQLVHHSNPVVARQADLAVQEWSALPADEVPSPDDIGLDMPLTVVVDGLRAACMRLPDHSPALARLSSVLYHLLVVSRIMDLSLVSSFKRLGSGSFATVFVSEGRGGVVLKQIQDPTTFHLLEKEHIDLEILNQSCNTPSDLFFQLPRAYGYYYDYFSFAKELDVPSTVDMGLPPHALYVMQRVWPVSMGIAIRIRDMFFPERMRDQPVSPFLARLYLGKAALRPDNRFFNSENFPLDAERITQLGLPAGDIAAGMGQLLARINFRAGRDGRDIEFVLCGHPENPMSKLPWYSCMDFNQMRSHQGNVDVITSSITSNDPYYPRPGSTFWCRFTGAYMAEAEAVSPSAKTLATDVVDKLIDAWGPSG